MKPKGCPNCEVCGAALRWMDAYLMGVNMVVCEMCWGADVDVGAAREKAEARKAVE